MEVPFQAYLVYSWHYGSAPSLRPIAQSRRGEAASANLAENALSKDDMRRSWDCCGRFYTGRALVDMENAMCLVLAYDCRSRHCCSIIRSECKRPDKHKRLKLRKRHSFLQSGTPRCSYAMDKRLATQRRRRIHAKID